MPLSRKRNAASRVALAACCAAALHAFAAGEAKVVSKVEPEFPREAAQAGAEKGSVKARMTIDAGGEVTRVDILEANPRRVFDRAVTRALSQWRFAAGDGGRTFDIQIDFKR